MEYFKQDLQECDVDAYGLGNYSTLEGAQSACTADNNCQGVYDFFCVETGTLNAILKFIGYIFGPPGGFYFCPKHAQLRTSKASCVYTKRKKIFNFQVIIKISPYFLNLSSKTYKYKKFIDHRSLDKARSTCDWLTPNDIDELKCKDGTSCKSASCCNGHGGRAKCPSTLPFMCSDKSCAGGNDYCCSKSKLGCLEKAGGLRKCGKYTTLSSNAHSNLKL